MALNFFSNWVNSLPSFVLTAPNKETDFRVGAISKMGSLSSGGTHRVALDPCCWKWHSSKLHRSMLPLWANLRRFFKSLLLLRVGTSDHGSRFSQSKAQLVKESLTLANPHHNLLGLLNMIRQKLSIPEILGVPKLPRRSSQIPIHDLQLLRRQSPTAPRFFMIFQTAESMGLKPLNPPLNSHWMMPKQLSHFIAGPSPTNKQYSMKTMIVTRFLRTKDFILQCDFHNLWVSNFQTSHGASLLNPIIHEECDYSNYFILH